MPIEYVHMLIRHTTSVRAGSSYSESAHMANLLMYGESAYGEKAYGETT